MSAETLRKAAALMRERAEAATPDICPEWTRDAVRHIARNCDIECWHEDDDELLNQFPHDVGSSWNTWDRYKDAPHIASWHPVVALAVAAWLDYLPDHLDEFGVIPHGWGHGVEIARAYLNEAEVTA